MYDTYIPDKGFVETFFRISNRINRKRYIKRMLALVVISFVFGFVLNFALAIMDKEMLEGDMLASAMGGLTFIPSLALMIRRLHDLDRPAWWVIATFVPLLNLVLWLYLLFARGTYGPNQYGADPIEGCD
jgi:uncharacterized membrane protein YhaH (DUF805 family)